MNSKQKNILFHIKLSLAFFALLTLLVSNYTSYEVLKEKQKTSQSDNKDDDAKTETTLQILSVDAVFSVLKVDLSKTLYSIFTLNFCIVDNTYFTYETPLPRIPAIINTFERIIAINAP